MFPKSKPENTYTPKPYEQMTYPGQRVQIDVKVVPHSCIAGPELRLFQYTAIDEFTRLRFLAAYPEQSTYSSGAGSCGKAHSSATHLCAKFQQRFCCFDMV